MEKSQQKGTLFRRKILNNKFVVNTIIVLLMSLTVFALSKIGFILKPLAAIVGAIFLPILLAGIFFYLLNPIINFMERNTPSAFHRDFICGHDCTHHRNHFVGDSSVNKPNS